jgi:hypothetical protein
LLLESFLFQPLLVVLFLLFFPFLWVRIEAVFLLIFRVRVAIVLTLAVTFLFALAFLIILRFIAVQS